jgi:uncharacterized membrane protein YraQ (UPF0718 family)
MATREVRARGGPWIGVLGAVVVAALVRLALTTETAWLQNLVVVFGSLLVEAVPFVLLGAAVSAAIEVAVPASAFTAIGRLPERLQVPAAAMCGVAFPVCECGSVPVARSLVHRGLSPAASVSFMLAAPVVNPVVIASTFVAYRGRDTVVLMVGGRLVLGLLVAIVVGWLAGSLPREAFGAPVEGAPHDHAGAPNARPGRAGRFFAHMAGDAVFMGRFLVIGAAIAAAIQTLVPQSVIDPIATLPILGLAAMMGLAFVMSLCSESDAFVAASFVAFGPAAQLAFLVSGPMIDTKLAALYAGTFGPRLLRTVVVGVAATTLVLTMWVQVVFG